jgi:acetolactate synthase small subunit
MADIDTEELTGRIEAMDEEIQEFILDFISVLERTIEEEPRSGAAAANPGRGGLLP